MGFSSSDAEQYLRAPLDFLTNPYKGGTPRDFLDRSTRTSPARKLLIDPGRESRKRQKEALGEQQRQQRESEARARSEQRRIAEEDRRVNRKQPSIGLALAQSLLSQSAGPRSTFLSGLGGRPTFLGG